MRDRIWSWGQAPKAVVPVRIAVQVGTAGYSAIRVLNIIESIVISLPYLNAGIRHAVAVGIGYSAFNPAGFTWSAARYIPAVLNKWSILNEEWAKDGGLSSILICFVTHINSLHRYPQHVGQEDK